MISILNGYDPKTSIQIFPMSMGRFGLNPWGEPMYRIVLAESRCFLVNGKKRGDGAIRAQWMPLYPHIVDEFGRPEGQWIIEKWLDAFTFTGMTPTRWNRDKDMLSLGPYPSRGEYAMCGNTQFRPADTNIEKLIAMVNAGSKYSWAEKLNACRTKANGDQKVKDILCQDIIRDALPFHGTEPLAGYGGGRGTKTAPILKSANELHLPRPTNTTQVNGGPRMMTPRQARRFGFPHRKMEPVGITL